ncbi:MAG: hypothetical protein M1821_009681 [Bathelium mastoideum]|nr:MAG: hypothetical protein M1821_009681 [Bathelium mastoideum]
MTGDFCGNFSTVTPTRPGPVVATTLGTTFTSGTAYISYPAFSAVNGDAQGGLCGNTIPAGFLALPSSSISRSVSSQ